MKRLLAFIIAALLLLASCSTETSPKAKDSTQSIAAELERPISEPSQIDTTTAGISPTIGKGSEAASGITSVDSNVMTSSAGIFVSERSDYSQTDNLSTTAAPAPASGITDAGETECSHQWNTAACTAPQTCTICGITQGAPAGHVWQVSSNQKSIICSQCGASAVSADGCRTADEYDSIITAVRIYAESYQAQGLYFIWEEGYTFSREMGYFGIPFIEQEGTDGILRLLKRQVDRIAELMAAQEISTIQYKALWFIDDPFHTRFVVVYG